MPPAGQQVPPMQLKPGTHRRIVDAIATGATQEVAAKHASVGMNSVRRWMIRGREADAGLRVTLRELPDHVVAEYDALSDVAPSITREEPNPQSPYERALSELVPYEHRSCWALWRDSERAQAGFEVTNLALIEEAGRGYEFVETTTVDEFNADGSLKRRVQTSATKRTRNWTALAWLLERRFPERYSRRTVTELVGADGGPIQLEQTSDQLRDRALHLVDDVAARRAQRAASNGDNNGDAHASGNGA